MPLAIRILGVISLAVSSISLSLPLKIVHLGKLKI